MKRTVQREQQSFLQCCCGRRVPIEDGHNMGKRLYCCCGTEWKWSPGSEPPKFAAVFICRGCGKESSSKFGPHDDQVCGLCYNMGLRVFDKKVYVDLHTAMGMWREFGLEHWGKHADAIEAHQGRRRS